MGRVGDDDATTAKYTNHHHHITITNLSAEECPDDTGMVCADNGGKKHIYELF
jgi:hypothetical protein